MITMQISYHTRYKVQMMALILCPQIVIKIINLIAWGFMTLQMAEKFNGKVCQASCSLIDLKEFYRFSQRDTQKKVSIIYMEEFLILCQKWRLIQLNFMNL